LPQHLDETHLVNSAPNADANTPNNGTGQWFTSNGEAGQWFVTNGTISSGTAQLGFLAQHVDETDLVNSTPGCVTADD
jgi:hypothetical protein